MLSASEFPRKLARFGDRSWTCLLVEYCHEVPEALIDFSLCCIWLASRRKTWSSWRPRIGGHQSDSGRRYALERSTVSWFGMSQRRRQHCHAGESQGEEFHAQQERVLESVDIRTERVARGAMQRCGQPQQLKSIPQDKLKKVIAHQPQSSIGHIESSWHKATG